jgi:competence protein ComEA
MITAWVVSNIAGFAVTPAKSPGQCGEQGVLMNFFPFSRLLVIMCAGALVVSVSAAEQRQPVSSNAPDRPGAESDGKLDLNTADLKSLEAVSVIGPDGARAIVAGRPFATVDELDRIKGISAERLEQIRAKVRVATHHTPAKLGEPTVGPTERAAGSKDRSDQKVDVNRADVKTLEAIPSIGTETARAIVAARPFATLDDLSRVNGISAERLEQIRAHVKVAAPPRATKRPLDAP